MAKEKKKVEALTDEDLKNASGGMKFEGAWEGIYPPGDPRWDNLRNYGSKRAEDLETALKREGLYQNFNPYGK